MIPTSPITVYSLTGQQTYKVPGGSVAVPSSVTVDGAAATFTASFDDDGTRTITITSPTISADGKVIVCAFGPDASVNLGSDGVNIDVAQPLDTFVITANGQSKVIDVSEDCSVVVQVTATGGNQTVFAQGSLDGVAWSNMTGVNASSGVYTTGFTNSTLNTLVRFNVTGFKYFRLNVTAYTATATLKINKSTLPAEGIDALAPLAAGSNIIGGISQVNASGGSGGLGTPTRLLSAAATTNATLVKSSTGRLYRIRGYNAAAAVRYLKLYNKTTAPTVGTDVPVATIALKPSDVFDVDFGSIGASFATGIGFGLTTGALDNDTGALTAADVVGLNVWYS